MLILNCVFANQIKILYTANINATYTDCNCGKNPLGGINRIKTYVDAYRVNNPQTLFVDGGNFFNSYSFPELNRSALQVLSILNYDLHSLGIHIFFEEKNLFTKFSKTYYDKIVNSNCNLKLKKYKDIIINKIPMRFYSFISPELFKYSKKPEWLTLTNNIDKIDYLDDGINIVIYNGYLADATKFLNKYKNFDILFLSTDQQRVNYSINNTTIIGSGHDAETIALVDIFYNNEISKIKTQYIDMDKSIESDLNVMRFFKHLNPDHN